MRSVSVVVRYRGEPKRDGHWHLLEVMFMEDCVFCRIVAGEIGADVVYSDDQLLAFRDIDPKAPVHILIIPKKHIETLFDLEDADSGTMGRIVGCAGELAREEGLMESGFRLVANCGDQAGQSVPHIHFHLMGGRSLTWPPG